MPYTLISATDVKPGSYVMLEGAPCVVKRVDISKTGKHGASKVRIEAIGIVDGKKRIAVMPGHERLEVPMIEKKRGQILSISEQKAMVMDSETFETLEASIDEEIAETLSEGDNVEYWNVEGVRIVKRKT
jgi:translation initiation factor 5A